MNLKERIKGFTILGELLRNFTQDIPGKYSLELKRTVDEQHITNPWFTQTNVIMAIGAIARELTEEKLNIWTSAYPALKEERKPYTAGVIMAGNIPLAGFHDFLCVLISGNRIVAKTSSKDSDLIGVISRILSSEEPEYEK